MFAALLAFAAAQVANPPQAPAPPPPVQAGDTKKVKQVCRTMEVTGSRMRARVCRDKFGNFVLPPGVSNSLDSKVRAYQDTDKGGPSIPQ